MFDSSHVVVTLRPLRRRFIRRPFEMPIAGRGVVIRIR